MNKDQFLEMLSRYEDDPKSLSSEEQTSFQQYLIDSGHDLPKYGADGEIGDETKSALESFKKSDDFTSTESTNAPAQSDASSQTEGNVGSPEANQESALQRKVRQTREKSSSFAENEGARQKFEKDKGFATRDAYNLVQTGVDASRLASAIGQIKSGKRQRDEAEKPSFNQREVSPELQGRYNQALARSQKGFTDAERSAMSQDDLYKYSNALQGVGALGQGQASIAGVGAQALHGQSLKSNLQRTVADAQARQSNEAYATQAASALAQDKDSLYRTNLQANYAPALQDYRRQLGEAGITERQGRVNMDNLMSVAPYRTANIANQYFGRNVQRGNESPLERQRRKGGYYEELSKRLQNQNQQPNMSMPNPNAPLMDMPDYEPYNPAMGLDNNYQFNV